MTEEEETCTVCKVAKAQYHFPPNHYCQKCWDIHNHDPKWEWLMGNTEENVKRGRY